jgi:hypothetical protein
MFELNVQNVVIVVLVAVVGYLVYKKMEGFANEHKHHEHKHHEHKHEHKHAKASKSAWNRQPQMDFGGYDIYHMPGKSIEDCEGLCEKEPLCTHTTFDGNATCYLKTPNGLQGHYMAGFKRKDNSYARYPNNDLAGFDLPGSGSPQPTLEACETACNNTNNCLNYTYGIQNQACYLKGPQQNNTPGLELSLKP